jgi:hypothetical protein
LLCNLFFCFSGKKGKQIVGLAMGSAFASALCILVLTMYEYVGTQSASFQKFTADLKREGTLLYAFRYVDDLRILVLRNAAFDASYASRVIDTMRQHIWHKVSPVKADNVNATVGMLLFFDFQQQQLRWLPSVKDILNFLLEAKSNGKVTRGLISLQLFSSFCPDSQRKGTLKGLFEKALACSSDRQTLDDAILLIFICLHMDCEYPVSYVKDVLKAWAKAKLHIAQLNGWIACIVAKVSKFVRLGTWCFSFNREQMLATFQHSVISYHMHERRIGCVS